MYPHRGILAKSSGPLLEHFVGPVGLLLCHHWQDPEIIGRTSYFSRAEKVGSWKVQLFANVMQVIECVGGPAGPLSCWPHPFWRNHLLKGNE